MAVTKLFLDQQARAKKFAFGTTTAGEDGLVTINKGTLAVTAVVLDVKGSQSIAGDLVVAGNISALTFDTQNVTNTNVKDLTITLNDGGTDAAAVGGGINIEGTGGAVIGAIRFISSGSRFTIGNGTTQSEIVDLSSTQTLTNKTIGVGQLTGTLGVANGGTGKASITSGALLVGAGTSAPTELVGTTTGQVPTWNNTTSTWGLSIPAGSTAYFRETVVSGAVDGSNKVFTLANAVSAGSLQFILEGATLRPGASYDYTLSGTTVTLNAGFPAPETGMSVWAMGTY